jgi:hypothetical protein
MKRRRPLTLEAEGPSVLICDLCRRHIGSPELPSTAGARTNRGWLLWDVERTDALVRELILTCNCPQPERLKWFHSLELTSAFAAPQRAGWHLVRLHTAYRWSAEQARRLAFIAWAVSATSTKPERRWCHVYSQLIAEI